MKQIIEYLSKQPKKLLIGLGFTLAILVGVVDYLTSPELSLFYLLPISLVAWFTSRWHGILISIVCAVIWLVAHLEIAYWTHLLFFCWDAIIRLGFFLVFTYVLSALKRALDHEKELARVDYLTGVANRRSFYDSVNVEINRAKRYKHPFTIAYIDVDDFKTVNDSFGHIIGDTILRLVAETIKNNVRVSDVIARLGGDEFALFLPETEYKSAKGLIHRVQETLLDVMQKKGWPVTFSIGVITFTNPPNSIDEMIKKADGLMYSVKNKGKNMINHEIFSESSTIPQ